VIALVIVETVRAFGFPGATGAAAGGSVRTTCTKHSRLSTLPAAASSVSAPSVTATVVRPSSQRCWVVVLPSVTITCSALMRTALLSADASPATTRTQYVPGSGTLICHVWPAVSGTKAS
jgi:hypothetical protein